jgi:hypothetical protein
MINPVREKASKFNVLMQSPGGAEGNRTPDLCSAIAALSHLSYSPGPGGEGLRVGPRAVKTRSWLVCGAQWRRDYMPFRKRAWSMTPLARTGISASA